MYLLSPTRISGRTWAVQDRRNSQCPAAAPARETEGGVKIAYQNGDSYTLDYYMPDFTGAKDHTATDMALGYNATVTVKHNGVFNGSFTSSAIGTEHGIFYQGISPPRSEFYFPARPRKRF